MKRLVEQPIQRVGGYTLDLYCKYWHDHFRGETANIPGRTKAECERKAKSDGWILHRDGLCTCPEHRPKKDKP